MTVDTACSSSLTGAAFGVSGAAAGRVRSGAGGWCAGDVRRHRLLVAMGLDSGMAPDGRCKAFSAAADGAGWSEAAGCWCSKRLSDAERDGDEISP